MPGVGVAAAAGIGAAAGLGAALAETYHEASARILDTGRQADRLGVSTESMVAINAFAGKSQEAMATSLNHFNRELGAARGGSINAHNKFASLGVSMEELNGLSLDKSLEKVMDRLHAMPDASQRAAGGLRHFRQERRRDQ